MKKITLLPVGIVLVSFLVFTVSAMAWRGNRGGGTAGWTFTTGQGGGGAYPGQGPTNAQLSQRSYRFGPTANAAPGWRQGFRSSQGKGFLDQGRRGCGGHRRGGGPRR